MFNPKHFSLNVRLVDEVGIHYTEGNIQKELLSEFEFDNEENCVRVAESMVREAFARARNKNQIS